MKSSFTNPDTTSIVWIKNYHVSNSSPIFWE